MTLDDIINYLIDAGIVETGATPAKRRAQAIHKICGLCEGMTQQGVYNWSRGVPPNRQSFFELYSNGKLKKAAKPTKKRQAAA